MPALKLIQSYLTKRKQKAKVSSTYKSQEGISFGVPQTFILSPLLFNICLRDLFWVMCKTDFASHADDNTPYVSGISIDGIKSLEDGSITFFKWCLDNQMKRNSNKCHFITNKQSCMYLKIGNINIENST